MSLRRRHVLSLSVLAATTFAATASQAQNASFSAGTAGTSASASGPETSPRDPWRWTIDLHAGLTYRLGEAEDSEARGGGLVGGDVLVGPRKWFALGLGYERGFLGRDDGGDVTDDALRLGRSTDALWFLGRIYPYETEDFALFVELGAAPVWQHISLAGSSRRDDRAGSPVETFSCSGDDGAKLGLRAGLGAELPVTNVVILYSSVGADHLRLTEGPIDGCGEAQGVGGIGPTTFLAGRLGFALATGRQKPPPPDGDKDGIEDTQDACPLVAGPRNVDPAKNGCPPPADTDGDQILDTQDACPTLAGIPSTDPTKHGCPPPPDTDKDGIEDAKDACPTLAGVPNEDPRKNGCPPDRDGDGIFDAADACPDLAGVQSDDPAKNGCPPDTDGDGFRDDQDACPKEKGLANSDPAKNGCPLVIFTEKEIVISQQVQFEVDKAAIRKESDELLEGVATVMKAHPEIKKLEVQGHTDSTGSKFRNKSLSQQRAEAVKKALVARGVDPKILVAKGYGQEQPIADNATDAGRATNRRVQFVILEKGETKVAPLVPMGKVEPAPPATPAPAAPAPAPTPTVGAAPAPAPAPKPASNDPY
jgi:OOP family OmpA-OmpF porin